MQGNLALTVSQGRSNFWAPSIGSGAVIWPTPLGPSVNPIPDSLSSIVQVWGHRRDTWIVGTAGLVGTNESNTGWFRPVTIEHRAATLASAGVCALHFVLHGQAFEVSFAGNAVDATLIVDGAYATPRNISTVLTEGVSGAQLLSFNTFARFDFGTPGTRRISFYGRSTIGPVSIAVGAGDRLEPWDRSDEPAVGVIADSYGGVPAARWGSAGMYREAMAQMAFPHVDVDAIGGTGFTPNLTNTDTINPGNAFGARIASTASRSPDLLLTAGGINDNNGSAAPPIYATAQEARIGFENATLRYFSDLRKALPSAVLAAIGPWNPNTGYYWDYALAKADAIEAGLRAAGGAWVFVDNLRGGWRNSSGMAAPATGTPWQTGTGNAGTPRGDGNGDLYVSADGTHPNEAGSTFLAGQLATNLRAALLAL